MKFEANLNKTSAIIGEKSNTIPGPPNGERIIRLRIGAKTGSVNTYINSANRLPRNIGSHDMIMRINKRMVKISKKTLAVFASTLPMPTTYRLRPVKKNHCHRRKSHLCNL